MSKKMTDIILITTAMSTGLIAGLFYAYSCSVNIGLGQLSDSNYLSAMQAINKAILNPWFFLTFIGTLLLLPIATWQHFSLPINIPFLLLLIASLLYIIGVFGVTVIGNVPLNDALANIDLQHATPEELNALRVKFENPWLMFHQIRTLSAIGCLLLVLISFFTKPGTN